MAYRITVWTEDDNEYELGKSFRTREAAESELEDIVTNGSEIDESPIREGIVSRD